MMLEQKSNTEFFESTVFNHTKSARFVILAVGLREADYRAKEHCLELDYIGQAISRSVTTLLSFDEQLRQQIISPDNTDIRLIELHQPDNYQIPATRIVKSIPLE